MENTISAKSINNRKIIIEIRFAPNPLVIDKRGALLSKFIESKLINAPHWELGTGEIKMSDNADANEIRTTIFSDINRLTVVSSNISSNESFYHLFDKTYKSFKEVIGEIDIVRIGCRILGTYKSQSNDYSKILMGFKNMFPSQILLEDYNVTDLRLQLNYQNGQYHVGPINKKDKFLNKEFSHSDAVNGIGFAIDTDNYMLKGPALKKINDVSIKDVILTSLSVEKSLFEKLSIL